MSRSAHVIVRVDLQRIRRNVQEIVTRCRVPVLAVIKADAYGVGAARVAPAIADGVDGFCVFTLDEAADARIWEKTSKPCIALGPNLGVSANDFIAHHVRPAVWDVERAAALRSARPLLTVDTGMQRFSCPPEQIEAVIRAGGCDEAFTHATSLDQVSLLRHLIANHQMKLHAAGSSLLDHPQAWLDAVRPGLALYRGAIEVSAPLVEVHQSTGPAGYSRFLAPHHGVILAGYSHGLRPGPCLVNGRRSRLLEVGMQSAFVATSDNDRVGDQVVLLGPHLSEQEIAADWKTSPHEVLTRLCGVGLREYSE